MPAPLRPISTTTTTPSAHLADTAATSTPLAPPVRVGVRELAGSVVVLTPGRSLLVTGDDDAAWRAIAQDCSVAAVATPAQIALAWVLKRSPVMLPIPGTGKVKGMSKRQQAILASGTTHAGPYLDVTP